jgi:acetylornithine deacetylase/succinyl-diaminopimelate desuccinylase-like protein
MERQPEVRRMLVCAFVLSTLFLLSVAGLRPPASRPAKTPADQFSAARALVFLRKLMGDESPHPAGSLANHEVRERIIGELTKLGYQPNVQTDFECNEYGMCATVNNVLARLDGAETNAAGSAESAVSSGEGAVLLAAHYDSVAAGPGACPNRAIPLSF